jgi:hypothetical protein
MVSSYRVRIKRGNEEIEVESTDKKYVDGKIEEFLTQSKKATPRVKPKLKRKRVGKSNVAKETSKDPQIDIAALVEHIKDSESYPKVEENILDKHYTVPKIMMCMHFAKEFSDNPYLTTGQVEKITDQFGTKIRMQNVGGSIVKNQRYFTGKITRRRGQPVPYKLNRSGETAFNKYLKGEKP